MSDEAAFIQAILDDPDEDAPRLVFADWLEEQGDAPRAEFIRVQCRLAGMTEADEGYRAVFDRESKLRELHSTSWNAPFALLGKSAFVCYERGFVAHIDVAGELDEGGVITDQHLECLAAAPLLASLNLSGAVVGDDGLAALSVLWNLRELLVHNCPVTPAGLRHLVALPYLFSVWSDLDWHAIDQFRRERVALFETWPAEYKRRVVRSFSRRYLQPGDPSALELNDAGVGADFASLLPALPEIRTLSLNDCPIDVDSLRYLAAMPGLERLYLQSTLCSDLFPLAGLTRLRELDLSGVTGLTNRGTAALVTLVGLASLSLNETGIGNATLNLISRLPQLRDLRIRGCDAVTDDAVLGLAEARPDLRIDVLGG